MRGSDFTDRHSASDFEGAVDVDRDRVLVERCQSGDLKAFDSLYLHYHQRLLRFCVKRLQERSEAEDVVQETFARAWRALPTFAGDRRFYPWLTVIAGNLCTDTLRRRARLTPLDETMMRTSDVGTYDIEDAVLQDVDAKMVTTAFENLKPRHQRVLDLRERSGWSYQRIAEEEGVGVSAVETLLWRARNALKREFALLAGTEGKAGALIGLAMTLPRNILRRLPTPFRHVAEAARHVASAVTPAGASMAAAGAVVVGLGAVYLSPGTSATATPTGGAPATTTVAPTSSAHGVGGEASSTSGPTTPPSATPSAGAGTAGVPATPTTSAATGGSGGGSSSTPAGSGNQSSPISGITQPLSGVTSDAGGAVAGAGSGVGGAVSGLGNAVGGAISGVGSTAGGALGGLGGALSGSSSSGSGLGQGTSGLTGGVGGAAAGAGTGLGQAITGITGATGSLLGGPQG
jgi:RNA polymerase sigma-70 factor, ECF subfamily